MDALRTRPKATSESADGVKYTPEVLKHALRHAGRRARRDFLFSPQRFCNTSLEWATNSLPAILTADPQRHYPTTLQMLEAAGAAQAATPGDGLFLFWGKVLLTYIK